MINPIMHDQMGGDHHATRAMPSMSLGELAALPAIVDLMTAARALAIGRTKAYDLARRGKFPCRVIKIEGSYRVPTAELQRVLGTGHAGTTSVV